MIYPVIIFCYKRFDALKLTVDALQKNFLANQTDLYIYSDAAKNINDRKSVEKVRLYLKSITGFKSIEIFEATANKGLANSIISGTTEVLKKHKGVIVVEDDLLTTQNFLSYMNEALNFYECNQKVFSVSGYSFKLRIPNSYCYDVYFTRRSSSWGWATWKDRWEKIDWSMKNFENTNWSIRKIFDFNKMGSDMYSMLRKQYLGEIDSWAIRFCFHQYLIEKYTVFPTSSKVQNIGYGHEATHTSGYDSFKTVLDSTNQTLFNFCEPSLEKKIIKQFRAKRGLVERLKGKIFKKLNLLSL